MADSMDTSIKHTLKRCDEIRDQYLTTPSRGSWWSEEHEHNLIEIRTDDVQNDHTVEDDATVQADLQKYDIVKFLERKNGEVIEEATVLFNLPRKDKDTFLEKILKPKTLRRREDHEHIDILTRKYKAKLSLDK